MAWLNEAISRLSSQPCCGYRAGGPAAVEPTALAAMALTAHGRPEAAAAALDWLADIQASDGSLGVSASTTRPCWPTGWALLAWRVAGRYDPRVQRAAAWILSVQGRPSPPSAEVQHDTTLIAWPWVEGTHSWVEPTAINLLALKASGYAEHVRSREAVRLLRDRAVRTGGWNYGNPEVFGTCLRPHVQSSGLALAALAGEESAGREIVLAAAYLRRSLSPDTAAASLSYAILGLAAHRQPLPQSAAWLERAALRTFEEGASPYRLALLTLAASGSNCPWFTPPLRPVSDSGLRPVSDRAACPTEGLQFAERNP